MTPHNNSPMSQTIALSVTLTLTLMTSLLTPVMTSPDRGCTGVRVKEGIAQLYNYDMVCAPLKAGQHQSDYGTSYLVCFFGKITWMNCPPYLRFDTESKSCRWLHQTTCDLPEHIKVEPLSPTLSPPKTEEPTTQRPTPKPTTKNPYWPWTYTPRPITQRPTQRPTSHRPITQRPTWRPITPRPTTHRPITQRPTWRPITQRPTVAPHHFNGPCNSNNCKNPQCFCYDEPPRSVSKASTPQFIMVTFDDAVTPLMFQRFYLPLLVKNEKKLFNPGGCTGRAAFYVSHNYTDYELVKKLYKAGHEIASHTINHRLPDGSHSSDLAGMRAEIQGQREMIVKQTGIQDLYENIKGFRAPFLRVAHDTMFQELAQDHFEYDSSITNARLQNHQKPIWPYTLDFKVPQNECINPPCNTKAFPGLFEVPLNSWLGDNGYPCSMVDECWVGENANTASQEEWYALFKRNFDEHFYPEKVPMAFFMHASLFMRNANAYKALGSFLQDILSTHDDVWMVSPRQVTQWMKDQKTVEEMTSMKWGC